MEGFRGGGGGGQKLILLFMPTGVKRNLSEDKGQTLPRNPADGKGSARTEGLHNEFLHSIMRAECHDTI